MITLSTARETGALQPDRLQLVRCRYDHDEEGIAGATEVLAPDGTRLLLPASLHRAVPRRQAEYLAGRWCSAMALRSWGADEQVTTNPDRSPCWPAGYVGSISHAAGSALAVVAREHDYQAIGVDLEQLMTDAGAERMGPTVLQPHEWWHRPVGWTQAHFVTLVFSAKEALYKAVHPAGRRILEFRDAELIALDTDQLSLALRPDCRPATLPTAVHQVTYRFDAHMFTTLLAVGRDASMTNWAGGRGTSPSRSREIAPAGLL